MTTSCHRVGEGDLVTAPCTASSLTGSSQKTEAGHGESDPGVAGSGQKTATGHAEKTSESERDGNDSGQKTTIDHAATAHG